jgi:2-polyprenyl-6-methoxyphenol hydroxylase-like FAD-dependent oxidoreductase
VDVAVIGGGPAGAIAALELRRLGFTVTMLHRPDRRAHWPETIPPVAIDILRRLGLEDVLREAAIMEVAEKLVDWPPEPPASVQRPGSIAICRQRFDPGLRRAAADSGVSIEVATATPPNRLDEGGFRVPIRGEAERDLRARFVVIATGRGRFGAEGPHPTAARMVAVYGALPGHDRPVGRMDIFRIDKGWLWGLRLPEACHRIAFAMPQLSGERLSPEVMLNPVLPEGLALSGRFSFIRAADATPRLSNAFDGVGCLRVGDALVTVDPLASSGLYIASLTALQGARVINTMVRREGDGIAAAAFYADMQSRISQSCAEAAAAFYAGTQHPPGEHLPAPAAPRDQHLKYVRARDVQCAPVTVLQGDLIAAVYAVVRDRRPPLTTMEGVAIGGLLDQLQSPLSLSDAAAQWTILSPTGRAELAELLVREGVLVPAD